MDNETTFQFGEKLKLRFLRRDLTFRKQARTSRDVLHTRPVWYSQLEDKRGNRGLGEIAPLAGLSRETFDQVQSFLEYTQIHGLSESDFVRSVDYPSVRFGLEMALQQLKHSSDETWFPGDFDAGNFAIPINGLVWMNDCETMLSDAIDLVQKGFTCIKFKVGGQDFNEEVRMLDAFRNRFSASEVAIRLDANGAFSMRDVERKLKLLAQFEVHSIEQPVKPGEMPPHHPDWPIPVALDEELIGLRNADEKRVLLQSIKPDYIVLKPTLTGGFRESEEWIAAAEKLGIGWWITSMLESNVALKAIAEWTAQWKPTFPQGLGTGSLYLNNIPCSLRVEAPVLKSDPSVSNAFNEIFTL